MQNVVCLSGVTYECSHVTPSAALRSTTPRQAVAPSSFIGICRPSGKVRWTMYLGMGRRCQRGVARTSVRLPIFATPRAASGPRACEVEQRAGRTTLSHVPQLLGLGEALELLERLVLDLADALARDVERPADLVQRARVLAAEAVAQLQHAALAVGEVLQRL